MSIVQALGIGSDSIYVSWSLNSGNLPVMTYHLKYMEEGTDNWFFSPTLVSVTATSHVVGSLAPGTAYRIQLAAENELGWGGRVLHDKPVATLSTEAEYQPVAELKVFFKSCQCIRVGHEA